MNSDGTGLKALTRNTAGAPVTNSELSPQGGYSSDGSKIVFISNRDVTLTDGVWNGTPTPSWNVWLMASDGTGIRPITKNGTQAGLQVLFPRFSPDTSYVYFSYSQNLATTDSNWNAGAAQGLNVWRTNIDGTGLLAVTQHTQLAASASAFYGGTIADGTKIIVTSRTNLSGNFADAPNTNLNVWAMDPDGNNRTPLTQNTGITSSNAFVSRDRTKIYYNSATDPTLVWNGTTTTSWNLWTSKPDGTERTRLTQLTDGGKSIITAGKAWHQRSVCQ
jgi:Tol biopolymer transport system component